MLDYTCHDREEENDWNDKTVYEQEVGSGRSSDFNTMANDLSLLDPVPHFLKRGA